MTSLYDVLGVARDATADAIKAAFRSKAKVTHPDHGGTAESFALVSIAYDTLKDAERRAAYDRDGIISGAGLAKEEQARTAALNVIETMMTEILGEITNSEDSKPVTVDLIERMSSAIDSRIEQIHKAEQKIGRDIVRLTAFAERFTVRDGERNLLAGMIEYKIRAAKRARGSAREDRERHELARDILKDYAFEADPQPAPVANGGFPTSFVGTVALGNTGFGFG